MTPTKIAAVKILFRNEASKSEETYHSSLHNMRVVL
jgi:hypothetical protein